MADDSNPYNPYSPYQYSSQPTWPNIAGNWPNAPYALATGFQSPAGLPQYYGSPLDAPPEFYQGISHHGSLVEQVKHKRSRNGCFTCRARRVKCDERRPVCERCKKSKRECVYPKPSGENNKSRKEDCKDNGEQDGSGEESTDATEPTSTQGAAASDSTVSPRPRFSRSLSPTSPEYAQHLQYMRESSDQALNDMTIQPYLEFHKSNLTYHHYYFDSPSAAAFVHGFLHAQARRYRPLMYAVVAFSAYHRTVVNPKGHLGDFLPFYSHSLSLLRESLRKNEGEHVPALLTILQLAQVEEYLGDWVNLLSHQKAAHKILTQLFTPQSVTIDDTYNHILEWYCRFDLIAAYLAGEELTLRSEWLQVHNDYCRRQVEKFPENLVLKYQERSARWRSIASEIAKHFAQASKRTLDSKQAVEIAQMFLERLSEWRQEFTPDMLDDRSVLHQLPPSQLVEEPIEPDTVPIYGGGCAPANFLLLHCQSMEILLTFRITMMQQQPPSAQAFALVFRALKRIEGTTQSEETAGSLIALQGALGIAAICLPKGSPSINWCRQQFALIEAQGYIFPAAFRKKLSDAWDIDVQKWWLDGEDGFTPIVRSFREFIVHRTAAPQDKIREEIREMAGLFKAISLEEAAYAIKDEG